MKCAYNVQGNLANLAAYSAESRHQLLQARKEAVDAILSGERCPFRRVPAYEKTVEQHRAVRGRYNFCVVEGESKTGKTTWAKHGTGVDPSQVFYTNCNSCQEPDLRNLDPLIHKICVCDEAHPQLVLNYKEVFQSQNEWIRLGTSQTNCHSYEVMLQGMIFIILSNKWSEELNELQPSDKSWILKNQSYTRIYSNPLFLVEGQEASGHSFV